jgi:hypothetical protein
VMGLTFHKDVTTWGSQFPSCSCGMMFKDRFIIDSHITAHRVNFSTSHAYELQRFVLRAEWWGEFYWWAVRWDEKWVTGPPEPGAFTKWLFSDASRFADLVAEFRGWKK